jgi:endonuclease/exonuclease/phosphatase family metal-dependent hydrolase
MPGKRRTIRLALACLSLILTASLLVNWLCIPLKAVKLCGHGKPPPPARVITLATWNLCHGRGSNKAPWPVFEPAKRDARLAEMAAVLAKAGVDIIVLNECAFSSTGTGGPDQAAYLADRLGLKWRAEQRNGDVWAVCVGHQWGNAVLSRFPILGAALVELPQQETWSVTLGLKRKNALECRIALNPETIIRVIAAHLPVGKGADALRLRAAHVFEERRASTPEPVLLAGDLNDVVTSPPLALLLGSKHWHTCKDGLTFPSSSASKKIDWLLIPASWEINHQIIPQTTASDHLPVITTITLPDTPQTRQME